MGAMAVSTHLQDGQIGDFIFFDFLLEQFVFLLLRAFFYIYCYIIWFCLCGHLVETVRLLMAVEMRGNRVKLPPSFSSGMCHDTSFQKETVAFCCRTFIVRYRTRRDVSPIVTQCQQVLLACPGICKNSLNEAQRWGNNWPSHPTSKEQTQDGLTPTLWVTFPLRSVQELDVHLV